MNFYIWQKFRNILFKNQKDRFVSRALKNEKLRTAINNVKDKSDSTGVSESDYVALYEAIRKYRPQYVLECGTGKSTHILAQAMLEYCYEKYKGDIKLISMDNVEAWAKKNQEVLPEKFNEFVEIHYSPATDYAYSFVRGRCYSDIPDYPYSFVFVDGPPQKPEGMTQRMCDMDLVRLVAQSEQKIRAIIDKRLNSIVAYRLCFGDDKVEFCPQWNLGHIKPVNKHDLLLNEASYIKKSLMNPRVVPHTSLPF